MGSDASFRGSRHLPVSRKMQDCHKLICKAQRQSSRDCIYFTFSRTCGGLLGGWWAEPGGHINVDDWGPKVKHYSRAGETEMTGGESQHQPWIALLRWMHFTDIQCFHANAATSSPCNFNTALNPYSWWRDIKGKWLLWCNDLELTSRNVIIYIHIKRNKVAMIHGV